MALLFILKAFGFINLSWTLVIVFGVVDAISKKVVPELYRRSKSLIRRL